MTSSLSFSLTKLSQSHTLQHRPHKQRQILCSARREPTSGGRRFPNVDSRGSPMSSPHLCRRGLRPPRSRLDLSLVGNPRPNCMHAAARDPAGIPLSDRQKTDIWWQPEAELGHGVISPRRPPHTPPRWSPCTSHRSPVRRSARPPQSTSTKSSPVTTWLSGSGKYSDVG